MSCTRIRTRTPTRPRRRWPVAKRRPLVVELELELEFGLDGSILEIRARESSAVRVECVYDDETEFVDVCACECVVRVHDTRARDRAAGTTLTPLA